MSHEDGPFAIGVVIHHIHVQSTDENWKPTFNMVNRILMNKVFFIFCYFVIHFVLILDVLNLLL